MARVKKTYHNPDDLPDWSATFSQVVVVDAGTSRTVYVSGQVAVDPEGKVVGSRDLAAQATAALANLTRALASVDARPADVVRLGIYVRDYRREQAAVIGEALRHTFGDGPMPASTWLGVASLALDDLLIEIEAVAVTGAAFEPVATVQPDER